MNHAAMPMLYIKTAMRKIKPIIAPFMLAIPASLMLSACEPQLAGPPERPPLEGSTIVSDFDLLDASGNQMRDEDFAGKWQMVYFGYAFCPDVCPFDTTRMIKGYNQFIEENPEFAGEVEPIFITIDPERDTPEVVGKFAANFSPDLIGLSGSLEQIEAAAKSFAVSYQKGELREDGGYLMDHSRAAYLIDPRGNSIALIPVDLSGEAVAAELEKWIN